MKRVLFLSVTRYNLEGPDPAPHLRKKFEGLARETTPFVLAKGRPFHKKIWGTEFYLFPPSLFFWLAAFAFAFWLCLVKKIDLIIAQSPLMEGLAGVILKKTLRKELIVEIHGDWQVRKNLAKIAPIALKNADKIRAVAQYLVEKAKKISPRKPYFVFPTFTDLDDFLEEKDIRFDNFVLFVGRDDPVKGVKYLTEAFSKIEKDFPDFKLVLVGEGLPLGKLPLDGVREKMRHCYCLAVPSLSEGLPRVIMEAQALGKPIIASRTGGIPELVRDGETGFLSEPGDANQLADKLRILLGNRQLAMEMGGQGRLIIKEKFSNQRYLENYLEMIYS